ncbi:MAG: LuxR C-terminal-related transcriptional regulator [Dysgonamonadaceae bacterium]|jgi:DNA-binding NarL/FixJ family response regulator|nr:LuxR C-terminal-related transcriptional regulator [Dysgonamonadaceae bacterium]
MSINVRIAIIEPSAIIRNGIISVLHQLNRVQMEILEACEIKQLKNILAWKKIDILIINPLVHGLLSLQQIRKESANRDIKCIALQHVLFDSSTIKAYDEVINIYDSIDQINDKLTKLIREPEPVKSQESLTIREKEIIICVIKGMTNKQIAEKLHLSAHTVISHRRNIAVKLQIHSAAGLTIYAIVNKLINIDEIKDLPNSISE